MNSRKILINLVLAIVVVDIRINIGTRNVRGIKALTRIKIERKIGVKIDILAIIKVLIKIEVGIKKEAGIKIDIKMERKVTGVIIRKEAIKIARKEKKKIKKGVGIKINLVVVVARIDIGLIKIVIDIAVVAPSTINTNHHRHIRVVTKVLIERRRRANIEKKPKR